MYEIPTHIEVNKQSYPIRNKGDYRMVLDCFVALNDEELSHDERIYAALLIFYEYFGEDIPDDMEDEDIRFKICMNKLNELDTDTLEQLIKQMYIFFNCGNEIDDNKLKSYQLIDWKQDSQLISSAINKVSGQEIRALPYLHWWTFMGYYFAIGDSPLATIVGIRHKLATSQKLEKYERKFMQENPEYFKMDYRSVEDREYDRIVQEMWNSEG